MRWVLRASYFVVAAVMLFDSVCFHYWAFTVPSDQFNKQIGAAMGRGAFLAMGAALAFMSGWFAKRGAQ